MHLSHDALRAHLADRTVLVTGAGGSIGTELSRQLLSLRPAALVLVDVSEHNLFGLEHALPETATPVSFCLADVRAADGMNALFTRHQPDVVLHAAAYKHVPLMERHPVAAFRNNTLTTTQLLHQSVRHNVAQFVLISTDKAVAPVSVLGATKQLAEWAVRHAPDPVNAHIVRFGNVFGSRGSVVPRFLQQLADGKPLTVTHPEMERYFMTAHEASALTLQTLLLNDAPMYALKMGDPVRIQWLAEELIRRFGAPGPTADSIVYTGRRPGEKLAETLRAPAETVRATGHPRVLGLHGACPIQQQALEHHLSRLADLADAHANAALRRELLTNGAIAADAA
jgi:FlaA1/EpsC-like NDP-sugar epimerase